MKKKYDFKVSCLVSAYYAEKYLEGRLSNLFDQSWGADTVEIVVVCQGGSVEQEIAQAWVKGWDDNRFKIIVTSDIPTVYRAWNLAIEASSGQYLTNSNCDDRLEPHALEAMAKILDKKKVYSAVYADQHIVDEIDGEPISIFKWRDTNKKELPLLIQGCYLSNAPMWRASLNEEHGLFDASYHSAGDYEFWLRLAAAGCKFYHINEPLGSYLKVAGQRETREPVRSIWETARAREAYRRYL